MSYEDLSEDQRKIFTESMQLLLGSNETRKDTLRALRKADPKRTFPELDLDEKIEAARESDAKRIKEMEDKLLERDLTDRREKEHAKIRELGLDPLEVEKFARDNGGMTYDAASRFMIAEKKSAPPTPASLTPMRMPDETKEIMKNPNQWARERAFEVINELKAARRA